MIPKPPYNSAKKDYCIFEVQRKNDMDSSYVTACYPDNVEMTSQLLGYISGVRSKEVERVICYRFEEEWNIEKIEPVDNEKITYSDGVCADDVHSVRMGQL